ncbi:hypothetical protein M1329_00225 [Candidatus Marsarchaeota archaeon]|jgi:predicted RNase H-like HicB family nuclease|nr:hypothetical protein [Candidatus Marsarchaeota archaeon]MCL5099861.1 hypothetical protein [Candidatus Marsarchaeota archaeon]
MKMEIYGFKADVHRDGKWFVGTIDELHVQDQARSLRELESELKDAVDTAVEFLTEKSIVKTKSPVLRSLIARN